MSERDERLAAALHHAPDADLRAPAAVREAVLEHARAAVAGTPAARARHWWAGLPWGGSLAGLTAATLAGIVWLPALPTDPLFLPPAEVAAPAPLAAGSAEAPAAVASVPVPMARPAPAAAAAPSREREARRSAEAAPLKDAAQVAAPVPAPAPPPPAAPAAPAATPSADHAVGLAGERVEARGRADASRRAIAAAPADTTPPGLRALLAAGAAPPWAQRLQAHTQGRWRPHAPGPGAAWQASIDTPLGPARVGYEEAQVVWLDVTTGAAHAAPVDTDQRRRIALP